MKHTKDKIDYIGINSNKFIVGYGLDYDGLEEFT
jgi:hypoxanthine-guanine phosphoribosyltransferase